MRRGEIWWAKMPEPAGHRPVLLLSRDQAIQIRTLVTVAQITTVVRDIPTEILLGPADGMPKRYAVNTDVLATIPKSSLDKRLCTLGPEKLRAVAKALRFALGI